MQAQLSYTNEILKFEHFGVKTLKISICCESHVVGGGGGGTVQHAALTVARRDAKVSRGQVGSSGCILSQKLSSVWLRVRQ